jgi:hypothetical protein
MVVKSAPLVYASNNQPLPSEETWHYGGRWALLAPYSDWKVRVTPAPWMPQDASCEWDEIKREESHGCLINAFTVFYLTYYFMHACVKQLLKNLVLHEDVSGSYQGG